MAERHVHGGSKAGTYTNAYLMPREGGLDSPG